MNLKYVFALLVISVILIGLPKAQTYNSPYSVAISNTLSYVTNFANNTVSIVNSSSGKIIGTITGFDEPTAIAISPNQTFAYVTNYGDNEVIQITTANNTITERIPGFDKPTGIAITPNGTLGFVSNFGNDTITELAFKPLFQNPLTSGNSCNDAIGSYFALLVPFIGLLIIIIGLVWILSMVRKLEESNVKPINKEGIIRDLFMIFIIILSIAFMVVALGILFGC
jgi:hypothetical protein